MLMSNLNTIGGLHYEIMKRCYNPKSVNYKNYGGVGVTVCEEWHNRDNFRNWCKTNGYKTGMRISLIDKEKGYMPGNVVFNRAYVRNENSKIRMNKKRVENEKRERIEKYGIAYRKDSELSGVLHQMICRCYLEKDSAYKYYGERGIRVCDEWKNKGGIYNFHKWAMENGYKKGLTIDRIDANGNYEPSNCRWVTMKEQANNKRCTRKVLYKGELTPFSIVVKSENVSYGMLYDRMFKKGMCLNDALTEIKNKRI